MLNREIWARVPADARMTVTENTVITKGSHNDRTRSRLRISISDAHVHTDSAKTFRARAG
jgi:hypothetical protein